MNKVDRRSLLKLAGSAAMMPGISEMGMAFASRAGKVTYEVAAAGAQADMPPKYSVNFAVIGLDHNHILGITAAVQRGGGKLVSVYSKNAAGLADFKRRFGDVKVASSEDEILNDPNIKLVAAAPIPASVPCWPACRRQAPRPELRSESSRSSRRG